MLGVVGYYPPEHITDEPSVNLHGLRIVQRAEFKRESGRVGSRRLSGREFQVIGPTTENV